MLMARAGCRRSPPAGARLARGCSNRHRGRHGQGTRVGGCCQRHHRACLRWAWEASPSAAALACAGGRLWTFEKPNPHTEVRVLLRSPDISAACTALRSARLNPGIYGVRLGSPPSDAPDLDYKISVHEPEAWRQSTSDTDRMRRVVEVLRNAGLRARVGAIDTFPDSGEIQNCSPIVPQPPVFSAL